MEHDQNTFSYNLINSERVCYVDPESCLMSQTSNLLQLERRHFQELCDTRAVAHSLFSPLDSCHFGNLTRIEPFIPMVTYRIM